MKKIVILIAFYITSLFLLTSINAQNILCIGTITSISMTDFGIKDPSFQTKWSDYLQNRSWKWASGHITFSKEFVRMYVRYLPTDDIGQDYYVVQEIIKNELDENGRKILTLSLKSPTSNNFFPSVLLYDDKEWVLTISGTEFVATWKGLVL